MTEPIEGNQATGVQAANPDASAQQGQPSAAEIAALYKRLDALEASNKALQSGKDKAVDRALKEIEPLKDSYAKFAKYLGIDEASASKAQREMLMDELIAERLGGRRTEAEAVGMAKADVNVVDTAGILKQVGLAENSPEAIEFLRGQYSDPDKAELTARRLKDRQANQPNPTPETSASVKGNAPSPDITPESADALYLQLKTLRRAPSQNRAQIAKLEKQLTDGGYPL